jgi:vancomycin resistance protein YoaR
MKKLSTLKLLFVLPAILLLFLITDNSLAVSVDSSGAKVLPSTSKLSGDANTLVSTIETTSNIISSKIGPAELASITDTTDDFFVKIGDQVVPIDYTLFSSQKTSIEYTSNPRYYPEIENINLCADDDIQIFTICDKTTTLKNRLNIHRDTIFNINKQKLSDYIESLNKSSKKIPKNVILAADTEGVITVVKKEEFGYELDTSEILGNILIYFNSLSRKKIVSLPIKTTAPAITSSNYKQLGLKEKIGSGKSNFRGSPKNRIHNIHNATDKFEGIIIAPDETFSFVENLGDVDETTGYKEELVIKNNETIPEFGGGICQVSTTLFRSAVNTGLEITERRNHAYPVQYYSPQGTDATIYIPKPDLQFKNDTDKYIMLQPHIEGTILTFDIFGTSDGRQVETEGPTLLKRGDDGSRKYVWWQIINDEDGKQLSKKGFWSYYQDAAKFHGGGNHDTKLTSKPKNWSGKEWKKYKREHGM